VLGFSRGSWLARGPTWVVGDSPSSPATWTQLGHEPPGRCRAKERQQL
jgi:hypothetical protein